MYFAGVDIGSTMTKVVLMDTTDRILSAIKGLLVLNIAS